ncbi:hypothetical protein FRC06_009758, partial [Ceratobasidium sp. 370]
SLSRALTRSNPERTVDTFLAAAKLRARPDPVEEYQKAERAMLKSSAATATPHLAAQAQQLQDAHAATQARRNTEEMESIVTLLAQLDMQRAGRTEIEARKVKEGVRGMWEGIEGAIRRDEDIRRKADEERRRVEEERRRKEEEQRRKEEEWVKAEAEKQRKEEEEMAKKAAQEATAKAQAEKEAAAKAQEEKTRKENEEKDKAAKAKAEGQAKAARTAGSGQQEWESAWTERASLKSVARALEENAELKSVTGKLRRKLRTRVGQVTNSRQELEKLADAIHEILSPTPAHPTPVYTALLSALCKNLLLQAETEVTAKLATAYPLGRLVWMVTSRGHERLPHVFFARLVGRTGGWACGWALTRKPGISDVEWRKMIGLELEGKNDPDDKPPTFESSAQYIDRLVGQLALYASTLQSPLPASLPFPTASNLLTAGSPNASIPSVFRLPRLWTLLARILNSRELLGQAPAPQVLSVILEVAGDRLHEVYGVQFKKLMGAVGDAVKHGVGGEGETPARVRLGLLVERWEREGSFGLEGRDLAAEVVAIRDTWPDIPNGSDLKCVVQQAVDALKGEEFKMYKANISAAEAKEIVMSDLEDPRFQLLDQWLSCGPTGLNLIKSRSLSNSNKRATVQAATIKYLNGKESASQAAKPSNLLSIQNGKYAIRNGRPYMATGRPIALYHRVFDEFKAAAACPPIIDFLNGTGAEIFTFIHQSRGIHPDEKTDNHVAPGRFYPWVTYFLDGDGHKINFRYIGTLGGEHGQQKAVFKARTMETTSRAIVVKFTRCYNGHAHKLSAEHGYAPKLLFDGSRHPGFPRPAGLLMMVMEYIVEVPRGPSYDEAYPTLRAALDLLHEQGLVFGDLRPLNVLVPKRPIGQEAKAMLIDFDWCGTDGEDRYPWDINQEIIWADGVGPGTLMYKRQDDFMLENIFRN